MKKFLCAAYATSLLMATTARAATVEERLEALESKLEVDEAYVEFEREIWLARVGRQYVPFGEFPSHFIEDPLTLALGETRATAVLAGLGNDLMQTSLFAFRGKADHLNTWGASAKITPAEGIEAGVSFLSDLTTSGAETWEELQQSRKRVAGAGAFAMVDFAPFQVCGEVLGALRDFDDGDLDADENGSGDRPLAWNMEAAWTILENLELAARLAGTREWAEAPKLQFGVDLSYGLGEGVVVSVEYLREEFDADFSSLSMRDIVVTQLAAEF